MEPVDINQALKSIGKEKCCKCSAKAKGLVYRKQAISYYCKKCLREFAEHSDSYTRKAAINTVA